MSALVDRWDRRENQMIAVLTQPDGTVTVTDGLDENHTIPSFPALQKQVLALVNELTGEVAGVRDIATHVTALAGAAAESATSSEVSSLASADSAKLSDVSAGSSANSAAASASSASSSEASRQAAAARAAASDLSASSSASSAKEAGASAALSGKEADDSAASASTAVIAMGDAQASRDLARAWATNLEDQPITPGEFSALHWAKKAQSFATGSLVYLGSWDASANTLPADAKKGAFYKISNQGKVSGITYRVGDNIVHNGTDWDLIDNTESVTAVAGKVGDVTLNIDDILSLTTVLAAKASVNHQHAIADVVGLQASLDSKLDKSGGKLTGTLVAPSFRGGGLNGPAFYIGDDAILADVDLANTVGIQGQSNPAAGAIQLGKSGPILSGSDSVASLSCQLIAQGFVVDGAAGTLGTAQMLRGNSTNTGYVEFRQKDGIRAGYVGYAGGGDKKILLAAENGYNYHFLNPVTTAGDVTLGGTLWFNGYVSSSSNVCVVATATTGYIYFRPNGPNNGLAETRLQSNGDLVVSSWVYAANFKLVSDLRLKTSIRRLNPRAELENIRKLIPLFYEKFGHMEYGFGAQDFEKVYPTSVTVSEGAAGPDTRTLAMLDVIAPLVAAVQALDERLTEAGL